MSIQQLKSKYFFCYSKGLKNWISNNNVPYITKARAISNNSEFWLYEESDALRGLVREYEVTKTEIKQRNFKAV